MATGFEALVGYLHLTGNYERINYIMNKAVTIELNKIIKESYKMTKKRKPIEEEKENLINSKKIK